MKRIALISLGAITAFIVLLIVFTLTPLTPIFVLTNQEVMADGVVSFIGSLTEGETTGFRLYFLGIHVHHYIIGIIGTIIAGAAIIYYKKFEQEAPYYFLLGFGLFLIIDELIPIILL